MAFQPATGVLLFPNVYNSTVKSNLKCVQFKVAHNALDIPVIGRLSITASLPIMLMRKT